MKTFELVLLLGMGIIGATLLAMGFAVFMSSEGYIVNCDLPEIQNGTSYCNDGEHGLKLVDPRSDD